MFADDDPNPPRRFVLSATILPSHDDDDDDECPKSSQEYAIDDTDNDNDNMVIPTLLEKQSALSESSSSCSVMKGSLPRKLRKELRRRISMNSFVAWAPLSLLAFAWTMSRRHPLHIAVTATFEGNHYVQYHQQYRNEIMNKLVEHSNVHDIFDKDGHEIDKPQHTPQQEQRIVNRLYKAISNTLNLPPQQQTNQQQTQQQQKVQKPPKQGETPANNKKQQPPVEKDVVASNNNNNNNNNNNDNNSPGTNNDYDPLSTTSELQKRMSMTTSTSTTTIFTTKALDNKKKTSSGKNLNAVIHIGPMKTGSSALQSSLGKVYEAMVKLDQYEDAGFAMDDGIEAYHMIGCFRPDAVPYTGGPEFEISCHPQALQQVSRIAERKHHIMITAEYLTDPNTNLTMFKEFLKPWSKQKIVAYYRRYYDWLISFHNQIYKQHDTPYTRQSITSFLENEVLHLFLWKQMYLIDSIERYSRYFDEIQIINLYDLPNHDVREVFYCTALINATNSCQSFRKVRQAEKKSKQKIQTENPSVPLVYMDMTYYAYEMNYWTNVSTTLNMTFVTHLTKRFQEKTLGKKFYEFTHIGNDVVTCPSKQIYDTLLQRSLQVEKILFPKYYYQHGEKEILEHYNKLQYTKMCHIDGRMVLEQSKEWRNFYKNLNRVYARNNEQPMNNNNNNNNNKNALPMQSKNDMTKSVPFSALSKQQILH